MHQAGAGDGVPGAAQKAHGAVVEQREDHRVLRIGQFVDASGGAAAWRRGHTRVVWDGLPHGRRTQKDTRGARCFKCIFKCISLLYDVISQALHAAEHIPS